MSRLSLPIAFIVLLLTPALACGGESSTHKPYMDLLIELGADRSASGRCEVFLPAESYRAAKRKQPNADLWARHFGAGAKGRYDDARKSVIATVRFSGAVLVGPDGRWGYALRDSATLSRIEQRSDGRYVVRLRQVDAQGRHVGRIAVLCPPKAEKPIFVAEVKGVIFRMPQHQTLDRDAAYAYLQRLLRERTQARAVSGLQDAPRPAQRRAQGGRNLIVNGVRLSGRALATVQQLERRYGGGLPNGTYWYDSVSGLFGRRGGPHLGRILPGLSLGGRLRADASGGQTGVYVNGRAIHTLELQAIYRVYGRAYNGRYWMRSDGTWGIEGGPALGNLFRAAAPRRRRGRSLLSQSGALSGGWVNSAGAVFKNGNSVHLGGG